ncbi:MAG: hypothetical protein ACOVQC_09920 [Flavobacterium sp.]
MRKLKYFLLISLFLLFSCKSNIYRNVVEIKNKNNISNQKKLIIIKNKNFSPLKNIIKKLNGKLSKDNIIIFSWVNHLPKTGVNDYYCIIYNYDSKKTFYIKNTKEKIHDIIICNSNKEFESHSSILNIYLNKGKTLLESLEPFTSSEYGTSYNLIDTKNSLGFRIVGFDIKDKAIYELK